ncbi:MAG: hypothetical protein IID33_17420, partial [Planctomycetes bacterium]|nr:hypothetical protein [Planctomycetota bacterium]
MSAGDDGDGEASSSADTPEHIAARDFVRTPLLVRRNVVKVWRPLPMGIWFALGTSADRDLSIRRERTAAVGAAILVFVLIVCLGSVGLRADERGALRYFPLIGKSLSETPSSAAAQ